MKRSFGLQRRNVFDEPEEEQQPQAAAMNNKFTSKKTQESMLDALEQDPDLFDYDGVYDQLKAQSSLKKHKEEDGSHKKPRYIQGLMRASEKRKLDLERAEDKKVQREREAEGDAFGDKEKFVTTAYLERQKELRLLEEQERQRESLESGNVTLFYKGLLETKSADRGPVDLKVVQKPSQEKSVTQNEKDSVFKNAIASGRVQMNDSEEVVDKRQLLTGGLNFTAKALSQKVRDKEAQVLLEQQRAQQKAKEELERAEFEKRRQARELQARRRAEVQAQRVQVESIQEDQKVKVREELAKTFESSLSTDTISDAKARYLARKKAAQSLPE